VRSSAGRELHGGASHAKHRFMVLQTNPVASLQSISGPNVLFLLSDLEPGRATTDALEMAKFLKRAGGNPVVVSAGGKLDYDLDRMSIPHHTLPVGQGGLLGLRRNVHALLHLIEENAIHVVHALSLPAAWIGFFAAKRVGASFVTMAQMPYATAKPSRRFYHSIMARGDRVLTVSAFMSEHLQRQYDLAPERIRQLPYGIDLMRFNPDLVTAERMATLTENWRLPDGLKVILCPGRLAYGKGQLVLVEALAKLSRRDFICVLAGPDDDEDYADKIEQRTIDLGLEGHVSMVGECVDMPTAYMLADVVAVPHLTAGGFARVAAEAQAMGRPVVSADVGAAREAILHNETGWLARINEPEALAECLGLALDLTPEQRLRLGTKSITHIHTHFNKDEACWSVLDVYAELYNGPVPWEMNDPVSAAESR